MTLLPAPDRFLTPERQALHDSTAAFTQRHVVPELQRWEDDGELPRQLHKEAAAAGLLGIGFPESAGGAGGDLADNVTVIEAVLGAGGSGGLIASLFTHGIALPHIVDRQQPALTDTFVRPVLAGEQIAALAVTEPDGGSDVAHLRTTGRWTGDELVINGSKTFITSGVRADFLVAAVRTEGPGASGISLVVIPTNTPGFQVTRRLEKLGWQCSDTAELAFVDVRVPAANVLGPGQGFASLAKHFVTERLTLAATGYSTAARCLQLAETYARERTTFGKPLIARQAIRHKLVRMHEQVDITRSYCRDVAVRHSQGEEVTLAALQAKNASVAVCSDVVDEAVQIFGGAGYMRGSEVERHYRDARLLGIGGGATEVMRDLAAKLLGY